MMAYSAVCLGAGAEASVCRRADQSKPDSLRRDPPSYPVCGAFQTRFQDMDINGHLNNVAFAALFESGRVMMNRHVRPIGERAANERTMVAAVEINYLVDRKSTRLNSSH